MGWTNDYELDIHENGQYNYSYDTAVSGDGTVSAFAHLDDNNYVYEDKITIVENNQIIGEISTGMAVSAMVRISVDLNYDGTKLVYQIGGPNYNQMGGKVRIFERIPSGTSVTPNTYRETVTWNPSDGNLPILHIHSSGTRWLQLGTDHNGGNSIISGFNGSFQYPRALINNNGNIIAVYNPANIDWVEVFEWNSAYGRWDPISGGPDANHSNHWVHDYRVLKLSTGNPFTISKSSTSVYGLRICGVCQRAVDNRTQTILAEYKIPTNDEWQNTVTHFAKMIRGNYNAYTGNNPGTYAWVLVGEPINLTQTITISSYDSRGRLGMVTSDGSKLVQSHMGGQRISFVTCFEYRVPTANEWAIADDIGYPWVNETNLANGSVFFIAGRSAVYPDVYDSNAKFWVQTSNFYIPTTKYTSSKVYDTYYDKLVNYAINGDASRIAAVIELPYGNTATNPYIRVFNDGVSQAIISKPSGQSSFGDVVNMDESGYTLVQTGYFNNSNGHIFTTPPKPELGSYSITNITGSINQQITNSTVSITNGASASFYISPQLPTGLVIDNITGTISGIPTVIQSQQSHQITASNSTGSVTTTLNITINNASPGFHYGSDPILFKIGESKTVTPIITGGIPTSYQLTSGSLPGLTLDQTTGTISGTPTTKSSGSVTITGSNEPSYGTFPFSVNVIITTYNLLPGLNIQINAYLGESVDSGTVTRSISVAASAITNLYLLVQPSADAAPTASAIIAQGLDAAAVTFNTFSAVGLYSESDYVAYAVAKTSPTGSYQVTLRGEIASHDEYDTNKTGFSVSASADGSTIAVSVPGYDSPTQQNIGAVRVYDWTGGAWQHRAPDMIIGTGAHQWPGYNVRISADGNTVVCTSESHRWVRRFDWDGSTWNEQPPLVHGNATSFGLSLDASDDCSVIVVGAPMNNNASGTFHIYTWDGAAYVERLSADTHGSKQGSEVAVSGDGNVVAVGGLFLNPFHIKVYQRNSGDTFGPKYTVGSTQHPGASIALNSDGSLLAVAASNRVEVYKWTTDHYALQRSFYGLANYSYIGRSHLTHAQSIHTGYPPQYDLMSFGGAPGEELLCVTESNWPQNYGIVRIFEANTGTQIKQLTGGNNSEYGRAVSLSNDGKVVIVGAPEFHRVYTYDISDGSSTSAVSTQAFTTGDLTAPVVTTDNFGNYEGIVGDITGTIKVAHTLTIDPSSLTDPEGISGSISYQWKRSQTSGGTYADISGATSNTYTIKQADLGYYFKVALSYTDNAGISENVESLPTSQAVQSQPTISLSGHNRIGETVTYSLSGWPSGVTTNSFSHVWSSDGSTVGTGSSYPIVSSDAGKLIALQITYNGDVWSDTSTKNVNHPLTGSLQISGTTYPTNSISINTNSIFDGDGLGSFSYTWFKNGTPISYSQTLSVSKSYENNTLIGKVVYTDGNQNTESTQTSVSISPISVGSITSNTSPIVKASILTVPTPTNFTGYVQWIRIANGQESVVASNNNSYTVTQQDEFHSIKARFSSGQNGTGDTWDTSPISISTANNPPSGVPVITGNAFSSHTLSINLSGISDTDGFDQASANYEWQISSNNTSFSAIANETSSILYISKVYETQYIKVSVTYTDDSGYSNNVVSSSVQISATQISMNENASQFKTGTNITLNLQQMDTNSIASYEWYRASSVIPNSNANSLTLSTDDQGKQVKCRVTTSNGDVYETNSSLVNTPPSGSMSITGTNYPGHELSANISGFGDADGIPSNVTYTWTNDGTVYSNTNHSSDQTKFLVLNQHVGKSIKFKIAYTDDNGFAEELESQSVPIHSADPLVLKQTAVENYLYFREGHQIDVILPSQWSLQPNEISYVWYAGSLAISGATSSQYTVQTTDEGELLSCYVTSSVTGESWESNRVIINSRPTGTFETRAFDEISAPLMYAGNYITAYADLSDPDNNGVPVVLSGWEWLNQSNQSIVPTTQVFEISASNGAYVIKDQSEFHLSGNVYLQTGVTYNFKNVPYNHPIAILDGDAAGISYSMNASVYDIHVSGGETSHVFADAKGNVLPVDNGTFKFMKDKTYRFVDAGIAAGVTFEVIKGGVTHAIGDQILFENIPITYNSQSNDRSDVSGAFQETEFSKDVNGKTYTFYYGDVDVTVNADFQQSSLYCYHHGYMGSQNRLKYNNGSKYLLDVGNEGANIYSRVTSTDASGVSHIVTSQAVSVSERIRFSYSQSTLDIWKNIANSHTVQAQVGTGSFAIDKTLPNGLTFDTNTGEISGSPIVTTFDNPYTITGSNSGGAFSVQVNLQINYTILGQLIISLFNDNTLESQIYSMIDAIDNTSTQADINAIYQAIPTDNTTDYSALLSQITKSILQKRTTDFTVSKIAFSPFVKNDSNLSLMKSTIKVYQNRVPPNFIVQDIVHSFSNESFYMPLDDGDAPITIVDSDRRDSSENDVIALNLTNPGRFQISRSGNVFSLIAEDSSKNCLTTGSNALGEVFTYNNDTATNDGTDYRAIFTWGSVRGTSTSATTLASSVGDPYITTLGGKLYKLPNYVGFIRIFDNRISNNRLVINAETWQLPTNVIELDELTLGTKLDPAATYYKTVYINYKGREYMIDLERMSVLQNNENSAIKFVIKQYTQMTAYKNEPYLAYTLHIDSYVVELQRFKNPQIRTGIQIKGLRFNKNYFGALVDHFHIRDLKVKRINDTTMPPTSQLKPRSNKGVVFEVFTKDNESRTIEFNKY